MAVVKPKFPPKYYQTGDTVEKLDRPDPPMHQDRTPHEVLRAAGYPDPIVVLDFETYFDPQYSLRKMSTIEYVTDPQFEVLGVAQAHQTGPQDEPELQWIGGEVETRQHLRALQDQYGMQLEGCTVVAHNAAFDGQVLAVHYGIWPRYLIDTLGLARHWNARDRNDLGRLAKRFKLPDKGVTATFTSWTNRTRYMVPKSRKKGPTLPVKQPVMTPEQQQELGDYAIRDAELEIQILHKLLPRLSNPATELRVMQHTLELFLRPRIMVDEERAEELKKLMTQEVDAAVDAAAELIGTSLTRRAISGTNSFETLVANVLPKDEPLSRYTKPAKCKKGWKLAIAKTDPERELLLAHDSPQVKALMEARIAIKSWPGHIKRIDKIVNQARAAGGKLPVPLKYHGAHTGRWSGGEKINLQNLGSRGHELVSAVRELLIAVPRHLFVIADASQIEARVLAWVAGQTDLLEKFARGEEIYCGFAEKVLGYPVRKPRPDGIPAIEARMKWARNSVGKVGVLGCGYGMGAAKAISYSGDSLDLPTAQDLVATYRAENPAVTQFWENIERMFIYAYRYNQAVTSYGLRVAPGAQISPLLKDVDMTITLPSGRMLYYQSVRVQQQRGRPVVEIYNAQERHWVRIWGGYLTENIVQAISRDLLWGAIASLEAQGHQIVLHVHDELIAMVKAEDAEDTLEAAIAALSTRPSWAPDLPLAAEGVVTSRYGGH